jgi:branched-chain amino acid transport system permease protein
VLRRLPREPDAVVGALLAIVLVVIAVAGSRQIVYTATIIAIFGMSVVGLNVLMGLAGQASFAQGSFMAIGGYGLAILSTHYGWNPWPAAVAGVALAALFAFVIGIPLLRLRGHYLAVGTLAVALATTSIALGAQPLTGGSAGIAQVPQFTVGTLSLADPRLYFLLSWLACAIALYGFVALKRSYVGRAWRALATRDAVAQSLGVDVSRLKMLAFVLSAALAAAAGVLYVALTTYVSSDVFDLNFAVSLFLMLFIGGRGLTFGPILGAAVVVYIPQIVPGGPRLTALIFQVLLILIILFAPAGLLGGRPTWSLPLRRIREPRSRATARAPQ